MQWHSRYARVCGAPALVVCVTPVCWCAVQADAAGVSPSPAPTAAYLSGTSVEVLGYLLRELDADGRYAVLNGIVNQLRYPNSHTYFFSTLLLHVFAEGGSDDPIKEHITRVLLERLIVHRPHPWGLLVTFMELIKTPRYSFWSHHFTRSSPEIQRLFESVARSCMPAGSDATPSPAGSADVAAELSNFSRLTTADR